jgi:GGDEF domain-containing protein
MDPAHRIVETLRRPFPVNGKELLIGASIGIADGDFGRITGSDIVAAADKAMYKAKRSHSTQISVSTAVGS